MTKHNTSARPSSRRLAPAEKLARRKYRDYVRLFTSLHVERAEIARRFVQMMVMDILHHFPEQAPTFTGIDEALKTSALPDLDALALSVAELRERLHDAKTEAVSPITVH
jgi:hypothetical protein